MCLQIPKCSLRETSWTQPHQNIITNFSWIFIDLNRELLRWIWLSCSSDRCHAKDSVDLIANWIGDREAKPMVALRLWSCMISFGLKSLVLLTICYQLTWFEAKLDPKCQEVLLPTDCLGFGLGRLHDYQYAGDMQKWTLSAIHPSAIVCPRIEGVKAQWLAEIV